MKSPARARACGAEFGPAISIWHFFPESSGPRLYALFSRNPPVGSRPAGRRPVHAHMLKFSCLWTGLSLHQRYSYCLSTAFLCSRMNLRSFDKNFILCYNIKKRKIPRLQYLQNIKIYIIIYSGEKFFPNADLIFKKIYIIIYV